MLFKSSAFTLTPCSVTLVVNPIQSELQQPKLFTGLSNASTKAGIGLGLLIRLWCVVVLTSSNAPCLGKHTVLLMRPQDMVMV